MVYWLDHRTPRFPDPSEALASPNGLLAAGGNLRTETLISAYRQGIFPWYEEGQPILWWSPDPRAVLVPERVHVSRSLRGSLRRDKLEITSDRAFAAVIAACTEPRKNTDGTWITGAMTRAYEQLHLEGVAHSVECWRQDILVGGLYGVVTGGIFSGESMFSRADNVSKIALITLASALRENGFSLIDCQVPSSHLSSLGAESMARREFLARLSAQKDRPTRWPDSLQLAKVYQKLCDR